MKANRWELATNRGWMASTALLDANVLYLAPLRDLQQPTAAKVFRFEHIQGIRNRPNR